MDVFFYMAKLSREGGKETIKVKPNTPPYKIGCRKWFFERHVLGKDLEVVSCVGMVTIVNAGVWRDRVNLAIKSNYILTPSV